VESFLEGDRRLANSTDTSEFGDNWSPLHYAGEYKGGVSSSFRGFKRLIL